MDADLKVRKQVTLSQLKGLIEFLKEHQELAKGLTRGRRGKLHTLKVWNLCAKKLNIDKDGANKDGKAWSKYWCDWKYRVKRRALELKAAKDNNRAPPEGVTPLSGMEETILSIIGEAAINNVVVKSDPLAEDTDEAPDNNEKSLTRNQNYAPADSARRTLRASTVRKRRHSSRDMSDMDERGRGTPSPDRMIGLNHNGESEEDEAAEFLRLEREKLWQARRLHATVRALTGEVARLADAAAHIRDTLLHNSSNI